MSAAAQQREPRTQPGERLQHVIQGEFAVVDKPGVILTTLLGSCVAVCLHDPVAKVGGLNHFLLPGDSSQSGQSLKYGVNAMELLINGLIKVGASRDRLQAKAFGGGRVVSGLGAIGAKNIQFAREFLEMEGIPCLAESLGGDKARRIRFWPDTGRATQMLLESTAPEVVEVETKVTPPAPKAAASDLELF